MSQLIKFDVNVLPGQQIDALIKIPNERRGVVQGVVVDECDRPVENAVVKLYEKGDKYDEKHCCNLIPITHEFTDECGQFMFGPLCSDKCYTIKVWVNDVCQSYEKYEGRFCGECIESKPCRDGKPCRPEHPCKDECGKRPEHPCKDECGKRPEHQCKDECKKYPDRPCKPDDCDKRPERPCKPDDCDKHPEHPCKPDDCDKRPEHPCKPECEHPCRPEPKYRKPHTEITCCCDYPM